FLIVAVTDPKQSVRFQDAKRPSGGRCPNLSKSKSIQASRNAVRLSHKARSRVARAMRLDRCTSGGVMTRAN
ncbi:hypothetical protein QC281_47670, partial [Streptomyces sp. DH17]|nr:hypothetical protein [Streptomyces sp. DH17]